MDLSVNQLKAVIQLPAILITDQASVSENRKLHMIIKKLEEVGISVELVLGNNKPVHISVRQDCQKVVKLVISDDEGWEKCTRLYNQDKSDSYSFIVLHINVLDRLLSEYDHSKAFKWNGGCVKSLELGGKRCFINDMLCGDNLNVPSVSSFGSMSSALKIERGIDLDEQRKRSELIKLAIVENNGLVMGYEELIAHAQVIIIPHQPLVHMNSFSDEAKKRQQELLVEMARQRIPRKGEEWVRKLLEGNFSSTSQFLDSYPAAPLEGLIVNCPSMRDNVEKRERLGKLGGKMSASHVPGELYIVDSDTSSTDPTPLLTRRILRILNVNCVSKEWLDSCINARKIIRPTFVDVSFLEPFHEQLSLDGYKISLENLTGDEIIRAKAIVHKLGGCITNNPSCADAIITSRLTKNCKWASRARSMACLVDFYEQGTCHDASSCPESHYPTLGHDDDANPTDVSRPEILPDPLTNVLDVDNVLNEMWSSRDQGTYGICTGGEDN